MPTSDGFAKSNTVPSELRARYTAVLIIHGIGEQNPYETIDQFARTLSRYLRHENGIADLELIPDRVNRSDGIEAMLRLRTAGHGPQGQEGIIDLHEYYWAPETENKVNYRQSLWWLIKATVSPIRRFDENVSLQEDDSGQVLTKGKIFRRELLRIGLIYVPFLVLFAGLLLLIPSIVRMAGLLGRLSGLSYPEHPVAAGFTLLLLAVGIALSCIVIRQLFRSWLRRMRNWPAMMTSWWLLFTLLIAALCLAGALEVAKLAQLPVGQYLALISARKTLLTLAVLGLGRVLQIFLRDFVGDLAVYLNINQKAENHVVRMSILQGATHALARLLKGPVQRQSDKQYDQVIVIAHSLGSVIAYDSLNALINQSSAAPDQIEKGAPGETVTSDDLAKIKGLVTFGSPLDKVYYFFREEIREEQSIRAQLASYMDSFRKVPSGRDYGENRFLQYVPNQLGKDFKWLNAWSNQDPISGALHFYSNIERRKFTYLIPVYAHLSYWEDLQFYSFFAEPLLLGHATNPKIESVKRAAV
jgi:hypothetical protein